MRFQALNESSSSGEDDGDPDLATKEAQEEEAFAVYNNALKSLGQGKLPEAQDLFQKLLTLEFIAQTQVPDESGPKDEKPVLCPALNLKYLALKNLAVIAQKEKEFNASIGRYLEALDIDSTDINMWYQTGLVSLNLPNYPLSRLCFEEALKRNPNHWPSLDHVIASTYILNDYANCLYHISQALESEPFYLKGLVVKDQIYKENPGLQNFCGHYFGKCDPVVHTQQYEKEEAEQVVEELLLRREKSRSQYKVSPNPVLKLSSPIKEFTWKALGESLSKMYEHIANAETFTSFNCKIDLSDYLNGEKVDNAAMETDDSSGNLTTTEGKLPKHVLLRTTASQESSMERDEESPNVSDMSLMSGGFLDVLAESELKTHDPLLHPHMYGDTPSGNRKQPQQKRKRSLLSELTDFCGKRRSTRVRNPAVKRPQERDNVNYHEMLQQFLPPRLVGDSNFEDQDDSEEYQGRNTGDHTYGQVVEGSKPENLKDCSSFTSTEKQEVQSFICENQNNSGVIDLLHKYVTKLGTKSNTAWPKALLDIYLAAYVRWRKHISMPNLFCDESEKTFTKEIAYAILAFSEIKVDQWYVRTGRINSTFSQKMSSANPSSHLGPEFIGKNFHADMQFLLHLTCRLDILESDVIEFTIRSLWLKSKFHSVEGEVDFAVSSMEKLSDILQKEEASVKEVVIANSYFSNVVNLETVNQQLESLQRCQSLEEIQRLFENGEYQTVVNLLVITFGHTPKPKISSEGGVPERHSQLILLQDSLWKLGNYQECVKWTEVAFKESIQQYMNAGGTSAKSDWIDTMAHLLTGLERCAKIDKLLLTTLDDAKLIRLAQNLIFVICLQMDTYDIPAESPITALTWIILYRLIHNEEIKKKRDMRDSMEKKLGNGKANEAEKSSKSKMDVDLVSSEIETVMPSSFLLLITAHECLGRRSACCSSDGMFLLHSVDFMMEKLQGNSIRIQSYREDLENAIEQSFYCLYGHPHKRSKAKHLQEHNVSQIAITWERSMTMYRYFIPNVLPEFDSYRTSTVSAEIENLLKRIIPLVPPDIDPVPRVDVFNAYVEGGIEKFPEYSDDVRDEHQDFRDIFYLLGDYYFKNKEFSKAIRYYLLDVCINTTRLDSWAGMALSRSSQLDQKLNSYEVRNESAIWRKASSALRCFEYALRLNASTNSLWIEYGSLAYVLHSHASRQLKLSSYFDTPRDLLQVKKEEMLHLAERCFKEANKILYSDEPEEAWLHHYMLGKIAQKLGKPTGIFLDHYRKSLGYIHEDGARYPAKIQYHNPPELSIEVLEVYYRIHSTCLKYLCRYESTGMALKELKVYHDCLAAVSESPFSLFLEKTKVESESSSLSECAEPEKFSRYPEAQAKTTLDHTYYNRSNAKTKAAGNKQVLNDVCIKAEAEEIDSEASTGVREVVSYLLNSVSFLDVDGKTNVPLKTDIAPTLIDHLETVCTSTVSSLPDVMSKTTSDNLEPVVSKVSPAVDPKGISSDKANLTVTTEIFDEVTEDVNVNNLNDCKPTSVHQKVDVISGEAGQNFEMDDVVKALNEVIAEVISSHSTNVDSMQNKSILPTDNVCMELLPDQVSITKSNDVSMQDISKNQVAAPANRTLKEKKDVQSPDAMVTEEPQMPSENAVCPIPIEEVDEKELEESKKEIEKLIVICLNGLRECLKRFIQHYKSLYRIAYYYCNSNNCKNLQWAREVLLAATPTAKSYPSMPGLFAERKNTNFFNGIWRAPSNEIDRPGSFGAHMHRSVYLLTEVLSKQNDYNMLLYLTQQLYRNPDLGKKYMRDAERISLARKAYDCCVTILRDQMNSLLQEEPPPEESRLTCCLLEIYRTFQSLHKSGIYTDDTNDLLEEAYTMYKLGEVDRYPAVLEQAIFFCQQQLGKSYQVNPDSSRFSTVPKQAAVVNDAIAEGNLYTPDAWQREFAKSLVLPKTPLEIRADTKVLKESLLSMSLDKDMIQHKSVPSTSAHSAQGVHIKKPRAENLRACSVAFLPLAAVLPPNSMSSASLAEKTSLLSCQAYECYDILESLMHASGYQILSEAAATKANESFVALSEAADNVKDLSMPPPHSLIKNQKESGRPRANKMSRLDAEPAQATDYTDINKTKE